MAAYLQGRCQGCEGYLAVDDLGMCEDCGAKMDRDLARKREWDYSALTAFADVKDREKIRSAVIKEYGKKLELLA